MESLNLDDLAQVSGGATKYKCEICGRGVYIWRMCNGGCKRKCCGRCAKQRVKDCYHVYCETCKVDKCPDCSQPPADFATLSRLILS